MILRHKQKSLICLFKNQFYFQGTIIAIDKTEAKVNTIKQRCYEHSIDCVKTFVFDSTKIVSPEIDCSTRNILDGPTFPSETFDKILLDAPCSGLGNRPMLRYNFSVKMIESFPALQRKLFHSVSQKFIVFSTIILYVFTNKLIGRKTVEKKRTSRVQYLHHNTSRMRIARCVGFENLS